MSVNLCVDGVHSVATTAKLHSQFRDDLRKCMLGTERVRYNMVLFRCTASHRRFPTFHPKFTPDVNLQCLSTCQIEVEE